jgi:hypothetical protein
MGHSCKKKNSPLAVKTKDPIFVQLRDGWIIDLLEAKPAFEAGKIRRLIRRLNSYITLNPNVFGLGVNIDKIIDDVDSATTTKTC